MPPIIVQVEDVPALIVHEYGSIAFAQTLFLPVMLGTGRGLIVISLIEESLQPDEPIVCTNVTVQEPAVVQLTSTEFPVNVVGVPPVINQLFVTVVEFDA